ncbi:hypothetical protein BpHYR1_019498 [Brachionus plicatilis]|uniref:Uncharacterized protein n=1 Tax=Brachionus plicatilis TaxID=10195 RepID=A0A3M7S1Y0_BRAPC|nr:hypothetical protein BpHYR1_019498 [Brachionus plicatilis]
MFSSIDAFGYMRSEEQQINYTKEIYLNKKFKPVTVESLITGLITVNSCLSSKSTLSVNDCFIQPFCFYSVYIGPVSSKKSTCIELFKDEFDRAVETLNKFNCLGLKNSCLLSYSSCNITIESLVKELSIKALIDLHIT